MPAQTSLQITSLSVSNNYLYDEGISKLVKVLQKTTAPLETLDLSKTNMTSVGAKKVAQLLASDEGPLLPLRKLVLHNNEIDAEGYAAIGAAVRHERCGLKEIVVSTHTKEAKSSSRKTVVTTEHNSIKVEEVRTMVEMRQEFIGDAELMVLSEMLQLNTCAPLPPRAAAATRPRLSKPPLPSPKHVFLSPRPPPPSLLRLLLPLWPTGRFH